MSRQTLLARLVLPAAAILLAGGAVSASPAAAAAATCPSGSICVFEGVNFTGARDVVPSAPSSGECVFTIVARSGINNTDTSVAVERFGCGILSDWVSGIGAHSSTADFGGTGHGLTGLG